jgi:hypothetical protein
MVVTAPRLCVFWACAVGFLRVVRVAAVPQNFAVVLEDLNDATNTDNLSFDDQADYAAGLMYKLTLSWKHDPVEPVVDRGMGSNTGLGDGFYNAGMDGGICDHDTAWQHLASDNLPFWLPRFYPREFASSTASQATASTTASGSSAEQIFKKTGIKFASVDWQPCGHKDIVICHGESHYDFHLYYKTQDEVNSEDMRCDKTVPLHEQIMCMDDDNYACAEQSGPSARCPNHQYFKLMKDNQPQTIGGAAVDYCVDPTSAIPASGIHYGDKTETTSEWKKPVTIMGSHDCELTFFEPMVSWRWIQQRGRQTGQGSWPNFDSGNIVYNRKGFEGLPVRWQVKVGGSGQTELLNGQSMGDCSYNSGGGISPSNCHVKIVVYGKKCSDDNGCSQDGIGYGGSNRQCAGADSASGGI